MVNFGPLAAEIVSLVWGTPGNLNGFRVLAALLHGTLVVGVSQTAALNRGRHLYSTGRPSLWALAHILVFAYNMPKRIDESIADDSHRTVGFLQKLSTIDDVTKYRGIPVSRYLLTGNYSHPIGECTPQSFGTPPKSDPIYITTSFRLDIIT